MVAAIAASEAHAFSLPAIDGVPIAARYTSPRGRPRGGVLIANAMGVPQSFYAPLASWLGESGYHVVTFDYRGTGASRLGRMRDVEADIMTWAHCDATAALRALQDRAGALPLTWIGHSLGGQIIPFVPDHRELAKIVTIATGSGYWRENSPPMKHKAPLLWFVLAPLAVPLFGYFPGKAIHVIGDLPAGVMKQWRRWCLDPEYAAGAEPGALGAFASVKTPLVSISFTDDEMMSAKNTRSLHACYANARPELLRFTPTELGAERIGHFGFFRQPLLWPRLLSCELA
ncbi:MAG TPA: alpha/beta fold hydrolase [Kofleriaceae bacterium]